MIASKRLSTRTHVSFEKRRSWSNRCRRTRCIANVAKNETDAFGNLFHGLLWIGLVGYSYAYAPNGNPDGDVQMLQALLRLGNETSIALNEVFVSLFFLMGTWPCMYSALIVPTGKSGNGIPAWPFLLGSLAFGAFSLLPFLALWTSSETNPKGPPKLQELMDRGPSGWLPRLLESEFFAWYNFVTVIGCIVYAVHAGLDGWYGFYDLFLTSKFTHVMTLDFFTLTSLVPFWIEHDSRMRGWKGRDTWLIPLCCLPLLGPAIYLLCRPKAN